MEGDLENRVDTILVVDDNEANRLLAKATLEDEGMRVILATGGAEALVLFEREAPDCVVLDVRMPDVDGFAVCEGIRARDGETRTPVLFLTALRDVDTFDRALRVGGDDFLTKPIRPTELVVRVNAALKMRKIGAELREHYELLKRQRDELMRVQLQKERLMAFVVHDLKNPVAAMDLHAQLLLKDKTLSESAKSSASHIRSEARRLTRMILNLLDLSKGDEGRLEAKKTDLDFPKLITETLGELAVAAAARDVEIVIGATVDKLHADEELVQRTLVNLVDNALRHTPRGTRITVTSCRTKDAVEIRVADEGPGIPVESRSRIFDAFVQLDETVTARAQFGRGLGLAFCKLVAEAHHGRIWVEEGSPGAVLCVSFAA